MENFKGKLLYMGWFNLPWSLMSADNVQIDLCPIVGKFLSSLNGKRANHERKMDSYILVANESSGFQFKYIPDKCALLEKLEGVGMSNIHAYLDEALCWLSGRMVEIEIEDGKHIKFTADKSEDVFGVYFVGDGNSCEVPQGTEQTVCKIGQNDCCIFLSLTAEGFSCEKFSGSMARTLLNRLAKGDIRASRIGNCAILGRK